MFSESSISMHALHLASFNGHDNIIRVLIPNVVNDINEPDGTETTALVCATLQGCAEVSNYY